MSNSFYRLLKYWIRIREWLGVLLKDRWRYERALQSQSSLYLQLTNRHERLSPSPDGSGFACCWSFTSCLHAPKIHSELGIRLLRRCLRSAPIELTDLSGAVAGYEPEISVLIGHRGLQRLPLLLATLRSLAAQRGVFFECIVIEQDTEQKIAAHLPKWVRYLHSPTLDPKSPYNRSKAFNIGARMAKAPTLLLHDNDMVVPSCYLTRILEKIALGYDVVNPKRYVFYMNRNHTKAILQGLASIDAQPPESIVQNLEAGGSVAINRSAYWDIGGMDESFIGWGGEDNEFWDRCQILSCWVWGYEPIIHLWHTSQPLKQDTTNPNLKLARCKELIPRQQRIDQLKTLWHD